MTEKKLDNRKDILLLLLYSPAVAEQVNEPIVGRTRFVKMLFLFREEALAHFKKATAIDENNFYEFFPWDFGPFSQQVYDDLTFFILRGFIESSESEEEVLPESAEEWDKWLDASGAQFDEDSDESFVEESFRLTPKGLAFAQQLYLSLSDPQRQLLREFKRRLLSAPLRALLKYVYERYPAMTERSKIRGQVLGNIF